MRPSLAATRRGLNALAASMRRRLCTGGSVTTIQPFSISITATCSRELLLSIAARRGPTRSEEKCFQSMSTETTSS